MSKCFGMDINAVRGNLALSLYCISWWNEHYLLMCKLFKKCFPKCFSVNKAYTFYALDWVHLFQGCHGCFEVYLWIPIRCLCIYQTSAWTASKTEWLCRDMHMEALHIWKSKATFVKRWLILQLKHFMSPFFHGTALLI